jgi:hypothetical protein
MINFNDGCQFTYFFSLSHIQKRTDDNMVDSLTRGCN